MSAPCYPLPAAALELLGAHLKTVPDELTKQQPTITALLESLSAIWPELGPVSAEGKLSAAGGAKLRSLLSPNALAGTVSLVIERYETEWRTKCHVRTLPRAPTYIFTRWTNSHLAPRALRLRARPRLTSCSSTAQLAYPRPLLPIGGSLAAR